MRNELSVRRHGRSISHEIEDRGWKQQRNADRLVILIHGYQNSERKARSSFERFEAGLRAMAGTAIDDLTIWDYHWPGNHPIPPISMLSYSGKVYAARIAGDMLAEQWIAQRRPRQSVCIVAHSLGCRVALEAMQRIGTMLGQMPPTYRGARVQKLFLLAAAVPADMCRVGEPFGALVQQSRQYVFHSRQDRVLQVMFELGQLGAHETGGAVGRHGRPVQRWTLTHETYLGHSQYWKSEDIAAKVAALLGLPWLRGLAQRPLSSNAPFESPRATDERDLDARELPALGR